VEKIWNIRSESEQATESPTKRKKRGGVGGSNQLVEGNWRQKGSKMKSKTHVTVGEVKLLLNKEK